MVIKQRTNLVGIVIVGIVIGIVGIVVVGIVVVGIVIGNNNVVNWVTTALSIVVNFCCCHGNEEVQVGG